MVFATGHNKRLPMQHFLQDFFGNLWIRQFMDIRIHHCGNRSTKIVSVHHGAPTTFGAILMATVTLKGNEINTNGDLPAVGSQAPAFTAVDNGLAEVSLSDYAGKRVILNIFPSIDTPTCATSVRTFNAKAASAENTVVLCISQDLPFAQKRFCGAEGIENVVPLSTFRSDFADTYGVRFTTGPLTGLTARAVVVIEADGTVSHTELVSEVANEPSYVI